MLPALLLVACLVLSVSADDGSYLRYPSDSTSSTTTSSTSDSDSVDSRIANAVEAALRAAHDDEDVPAPTRNVPYKKYRLRLSTINKANSCFFFECNTEVEATCPTGAEQNFAPLEGAVVTLTTESGTYDACFDANGVASQLNDAVAFTVTFDGCRSFTLSTIVGERGVNATALTIATQKPGAAPNGNVYFTVVGDASTFTQTNGDDSLKAPTLNAAASATQIGCNATFDGAKWVGTTSFTVTPLVGTYLVANTTDAAASRTFTVQSVQRVTDYNGDQISQIGLGMLPCATRERVIYDEIAIATLRASDAAKAGTMTHPLLYDALLAGTASATPSFDNFIFQLQVAAARTQIRLRDVTLDSGAFSDLSFNSKFTPCFRVWPDADLQLQAFIGMRGAGGQYVRATLNSDAGLLEQLDSYGGHTTYALRELDGLSVDELPQFTVEEIAFGDLRPADDESPTRPYESLRSDVSVVLEDCPSFSYFQ